MLLSLLHAMLFLLASLLALPAAVLLLQVLASCRRAGPMVDHDGPQRPDVAVLVPAHDEEQGLAATLQGLRSQLAPGDRLLVVADNCSDRTAEVAAAEGAEVLVRDDPVRRGKGFALDHGLRYLSERPPAQVVFVDADCLLGDQALDRLARACSRTGRPVQALYLMTSPPGAGLAARIGELAWVLRNQVRPLGCLRLGWPCQLMGTGMALPWALLAGRSLATDHIVEDMQLGIDLAESGAAPWFCPEALVTSVFPLQREAQHVQRTRWEHGHMALILARGPGLLARAWRQRRSDLLAMSADLCVPPLASLVLGQFVVCLLALVVALAGGPSAALWVGACALTAVVLAVVIAWARCGRHIVSLAELLGVPWYVLRKLPVIWRMLTKRQTRWIRTERDDPG